MRIIASATQDSFRAVIGTPDDDAFDGFKFGETAEVRVDSRLWKDGRDVEVSFGAIGAHDAATARRRAKAYLAAAELADVLEAYKGEDLVFLSELVSSEVGPFAGIVS